MSAPFAGGPAQPAAGNWPDTAPSATPPHASSSSYPNPDATTHHLQQDWQPANSPAPTQPGQPGRPSQDAALYSTQLDVNNGSTALDKLSGQPPIRRPSGSRVCAKCHQSLSGQFVRALDATYHLECFTCQECGKIVASKFFPVPDEGPNQYPLCEKDYFRRLDLICFACGNALRGSYITALDRKYHIEHFTCSACPTVFGAQDSYYEHDSNVYCHYHYSTRFAQRCHGCHNAILKQFVEIFRNGQNQHWHPECYMIHKYWNVRLHNPEQSDPSAGARPESLDNAPDDVRRAVRAEEERVENKVMWIWRSLSTFEERAATCISDMLLHVSNGAYYEGIMAARKFIIHIELFFECTDDLDRMLTAETTTKGLSYGREAKLLCKKVVSFFQLLSESQSAGVQRLGVTQELLSLVTGLAHYLKLLIRICLQGALKLERETGSSGGLNAFLEKINLLDDRLQEDEGRDPIAESTPFVNRASDSCVVCDKPVEDKCARRVDRVFHNNCMLCMRCGADLKDNLPEARWSASLKQLLCWRDAAQAPDAEGGFVSITRLQQYVHLLKVAHARLLATLRSTGAIPPNLDDPNFGGHDPGRGNVQLPLTQDSAATQGSPARGARPQSTSYEQTLGDIRRLKSTRMDKELGSAVRRARSSRIIEGPGGGPRPGSADGPSSDTGGSRNVQVVHDRDPNSNPQLVFGVNQMALDDIPRILQAEVTRDLRPNAAKYAGNNLMAMEPRARLLNGHRRDTSGQNEAARKQRRYFSELTALEYVIVRPLAVLYMEPLLEGHFNQQELLDLIETKRPTFWDRFNKAFKNDKKKGVFGLSLERVVERDGAESTDGVGPGALRVPAVVDSAVTAMRNMDMSVEGVFRKNGNIRRLREMQEEIDTKGCEAVDLTRESPVQVAALLKKFLRDLPDTVLTHKLHKLFITAARIPDDEKRRRVLHLTCCLLPQAHRDTMEVLFTFLNWVSSFSTVDEESGSKMDIHNLATVIAPNILHSGAKNLEIENSFLAVEAVHSLIEYNESLCEVPEDILTVLNDPALFEGNAEPTTKDILKRYGQIGKSAAVTMQSYSASASASQAAQNMPRPGAMQHSATAGSYYVQPQPAGGASGPPTSGPPTPGAPMGGPMGAPMGGQMGAPMGGQMGAPMGGQMGAPMGGQMGAPMGGQMGTPSGVHPGAGQAMPQMGAQWGPGPSHVEPPQQGPSSIRPVGGPGGPPMGVGGGMMAGGPMMAPAAQPSSTGIPL